MGTTINNLVPKQSAVQTAATTANTTSPSNSSGIKLNSIFAADTDNNGLNKTEIESLLKNTKTFGEEATVQGFIDKFDDIDKRDGKADNNISQETLKEIAAFDNKDEKDLITTEDLSIYLGGKDVKEALQNLLTSRLSGQGQGQCQETPRQRLNRVVKASNENFDKAKIDTNDIKSADTNNDGFITKAEFESFFNKPEYSELKSDIGLYFKSLDQNDGTADGKIALKTFEDLAKLGDDKEKIDKADLVEFGKLAKGTKLGDDK